MLCPALIIVDIWAGPGWLLFWPMAVWSVGLAIHYFIASAYDVNEAWIEERIIDLRSRSYDFDHIRNIEKRVEDKDTSVTPHTERDS